MLSERRLILTKILFPITFHISVTAHPYLLKVKPSPQLLHHKLNLSPWEKKHFLGKKIKEKGKKERRKCSKKSRKPQIPLGSPAVLYVVPAEQQIFPLCTLMHSRRNQSGCIACVLGQVCMSYLKTALIFNVTALYSFFLVDLGLNTSSLELIIYGYLPVSAWSDRQAFRCFMVPVAQKPHPLPDSFWGYNNLLFLGMQQSSLPCWGEEEQHFSDGLMAIKRPVAIAVHGSASSGGPCWWAAKRQWHWGSPGVVGSLCQVRCPMGLVCWSNVSCPQMLTQSQVLVSHICKQKPLSQSPFLMSLMKLCGVVTIQQSRAGLCATAPLVLRAGWGLCKVASSVQCRCRSISKQSRSAISWISDKNHLVASLMKWRCRNPGWPGLVMCMVYLVHLSLSLELLHLPF